MKRIKAQAPVKAGAWGYAGDEKDRLRENDLNESIAERVAAGVTAPVV